MFEQGGANGCDRKDQGRISNGVALAPDGIVLAFACGEASMAFALAAIASDMSQPS